jgi:hypothetical protein
MLSTVVSGLNPSNVIGQSRRAKIIWATWFLAITSLTGVLGLFMLYTGSKPPIIAWLIFFMGTVAILYQPISGVYLTVFFALLSDTILAPWYPFVKNFSSVESIFYLNNQLIISPLEVYLALTLVSWLGRAAFQRKIKFYTGPLFWPTMLFMAFVVFGLAFGLGTGGNLNVALWEARPIFYLPVMLILVSNLITTRRHVSLLIWTALLAMVLLAIYGDVYFFFTLKGSLEGVNEITEHAAAVRMNTLFVFILAVWLYKGSTIKRFVLPWLAPIALVAYFATQRRSAFLSLAIALVLIALILFKERRRLFWMIVPPLVVIFGLYVVIFWNSTSTLAMPAEAIKSIVAQNQASVEDQLSNMYRVIENVNTSFTIHRHPLTGVGFGNKFYIIVPLPDISFFTWWEYITHNSIIWIWMKMGVGGFLSLLFLIGYSIMIGVRVLLRMPGGDLSAVALTAIIYIVMHFIYAYVDMSWDTQSMLYIGMMMGLINSLERIAAQPAPLPMKRWPWQPEPKPLPGLKHISESDI